jgi:hypothetical protein
MIPTLWQDPTARQSQFPQQQQYQQDGIYLSSYPPRQSAAIEVLLNRFGGSQGYYAGDEGGLTSTPIYTSQSLVGRDSAYGFGVSTALSSSTAFGPQGSGYNLRTELDNAYVFHQNELRRTFTSVRDNNLTEAGNSVNRISDWLLGNAVVLGRSTLQVLPRIYFGG